MLRKTMKQVITKKLDAWKSSITDESVVEAINKDLILTGGCFPSMIVNEMPKDFDIYFRTKETVLMVANYYADLWNKTKGAQFNKLGRKTKIFVLDGDNPSDEILEYYKTTKEDMNKHAAVMLRNTAPDRVKMIFPSDGVAGDKEQENAKKDSQIYNTAGLVTAPNAEDIVEELDEIAADEILEKEAKLYQPVFISTNAITLSGGIQLIVRFYGEPDQIHDTYDFQHTKAYYDISEGVVQIPNEVYEAVINKTLIYTGSLYPVCSIFRLRKFIGRGWTINAGQMLKICMQISELNLKDIDILEDQLVGVDSVYFLQLIEQFRARQDKDPDFVPDASYVISIIDKIF